ncbi:MAG: hypothetical protein WB660_17170 [Candidatus Sulfotelmatobacter sp.]
MGSKLASEYSAAVPGNYEETMSANRNIMRGWLCVLILFIAAVAMAAAKFGPPLSATTDNPNPRHTILSGTFMGLVLAK